MKWLVLLCLSVAIASCSPAGESAASEYTEANVTGAWTLDYNGKSIFDKSADKFIVGYGIETLILFPDGSYEQSFDDAKGGTYPTTKSTWVLSKNHSGKQVVLLNGMRCYKDGLSAAMSENPQTSIALIIEVSSSLPVGGTKRLVLGFDEADVFFGYERQN